jgi:hypothetical protein
VVLLWSLFLDLGYYGFWWIAFVAVAFAAARFGRGWGIVAGQVLIGLLILCIDTAWIGERMRTPGYQMEHGPDMDAAFDFGVMARAVLVNALLIPVSIAGVLLSRRPRQTRPTKG